MRKVKSKSLKSIQKPIRRIAKPRQANPLLIISTNLSEANANIANNTEAFRAAVISGNITAVRNIVNNQLITTTFTRNRVRGLRGVILFIRSGSSTGRQVIFL